VDCNLSFVVKYEGVFKVTGSHVHFKSGSVLKTVLDKDVETTVHKQEVIIMPYGHLIAADVMTLGVCQGHSSIGSFLARDVIYISRACLRCQCRLSLRLSVTEMHWRIRANLLPRDAMLSAVYAVAVCLSVCLSVCVCVSHSGIVSKRLNVGSRK